MKKQVLSFDEFIIESNNLIINEQEEKPAEPGKAEIPDNILYNKKSAEAGKNQWIVNSSKNSLVIKYFSEKENICSISFNEGTNNPVFLSKSPKDTDKDSKTISYEFKDPQNLIVTEVKEGNTTDESMKGKKRDVIEDLVRDFFSFCGQYEKLNSDYLKNFFNIIRPLGINKGKYDCPKSFYFFYAYIMNNTDKFKAIKMDKAEKEIERVKKMMPAAKK